MQLLEESAVLWIGLKTPLRERMGERSTSFMTPSEEDRRPHLSASGFTAITLISSLTAVPSLGRNSGCQNGMSSSKPGLPLAVTVAVAVLR